MPNYPDESKLSELEAEIKKREEYGIYRNLKEKKEILEERKAEKERIA